LIAKAKIKLSLMGLSGSMDTKTGRISKLLIGAPQVIEVGSMYWLGISFETFSKKPAIGNESKDGSGQGI
jgi:hypothetical protein